MSAELQQQPAPLEHHAPLVEARANGPVTEVTIGSGAKRNALTGAGWTQVECCIREVGNTDAVRAIVIRGQAGTFCAGSDMTEWTGAEPDAIEDSFARMEAAFR